MTAVSLPQRLCDVEQSPDFPVFYLNLRRIRGYVGSRAHLDSVVGRTGYALGQLLTARAPVDTGRNVPTFMFCARCPDYHSLREFLTAAGVAGLPDVDAAW